MDEELIKFRLFMLERLAEMGDIMSDVVRELSDIDKRLKELEKKP